MRARRVATRPVKRVDPYAGVLTDDEPTTSTRSAGWWTTGPQSPAEQWATFRAKLAEADGWMARAWVLLILGSACAVGIAAGGVAWLSQHLGVVAMLGVVAFLWWAVTITGGAP
ncbi:MAG: hypothetical protein L0I24_25070 [Pseudonocardia sp.]|nr:hypothetical protein [Pseudonocardia sp.]